jgi:hypothetical protein
LTVYAEASGKNNCMSFPASNPQAAASPTTGASAAAAANPKISATEEGASLHIGAHVIIRNVVSKPELIGKAGVCMEFDDKSGRWVVRWGQNDGVTEQTSSQ